MESVGTPVLTKEMTLTAKALYGVPRRKPTQLSIEVTFVQEPQLPTATVDIHRKNGNVVWKARRPVQDQCGNLIVLFFGSPALILGSPPAPHVKPPAAAMGAAIINRWKAEVQNGAYMKHWFGIL